MSAKERGSKTALSGTRNEGKGSDKEDDLGKWKIRRKLNKKEKKRKRTDIMKI